MRALISLAPIFTDPRMRITANVSACRAKDDMRVSVCLCLSVTVFLFVYLVLFICACTCTCVYLSNCLCVCVCILSVSVPVPVSVSVSVPVPVPVPVPVSMSMSPIYVYAYRWQWKGHISVELISQPIDYKIYCGFLEYPPHRPLWNLRVFTWNHKGHSNRESAV